MLPALRQPASRLALNFVRRYKWAFRPEYAKLRSQVAAPDLSAFASASAEVLKDEQEPLRLHFERARDGLAELNKLPVGVAGPWHEDRLQVNNSSRNLILFSQSKFFSPARLLDLYLLLRANLRSPCPLRSWGWTISMLQGLTGCGYPVGGFLAFSANRGI